MSSDGGEFGLPYVVRGLSNDVAELKKSAVSRAEHELQWRRAEERTDAVKDGVDDLNEKFDELVSADIPRRISNIEKTLEKLPGVIIRNATFVFSAVMFLLGLIAWAVAHVH